MATLRIASTHIQQGDSAAGLRCCDEAESLGPGPFDSATVRAIRGYGLVRSGNVVAGTALLKEVSAWLEQSRLRYTQCQIALWLAEAHLKAEALEAARTVIAPALELACSLGYRHLEGVAHRLLGEALFPGPAMEPHFRAALERLREVGATKEVAKTRLAMTRDIAHRERCGGPGNVRFQSDRLDASGRTPNITIEEGEVPHSITIRRADDQQTVMFDPSDQPIESGDVVKWTNEDEFDRHGATADTGMVLCRVMSFKEFGVIKIEDSSNKGDPITYYCPVHTSERGTISFKVEPATADRRKGGN
jgi:plastocyanin